MDFTTHQIVKGGIDETVTGKSRFPGEFGRNDEQPIMAATQSPGVTGMLGRVIDDFQSRRFEPDESFTHKRFNRRFGLIHAGNTFLNGLTLTLA